MAWIEARMDWNRTFWNEQGPCPAPVSHDGAHRVASLGQRDGVGIAKRDSPPLPMPIVLREVGFPAAGRHPHAMATLVVIENEHIALAFRAFQAIEGPC